MVNKINDLLSVASADRVKSVWYSLNVNIHWDRTCKPLCTEGKDGSRFVISFCLSVCLSAWNNSVATVRIFMKFDVYFSKICRENFSFIKIQKQKKTGTLHEDWWTFMKISQWIILRMRKITGKICAKNQKMFYLQWLFSRKSYRLWDNVENRDTYGEGTEDNTTRSMRVARWINKAENTHSEYVILMAFPCKDGYAKAPMLRLYKYLHYLSCLS
jgi:hypothetical protein